MPNKLQLDQAVAAQIEAKVKRIAELERCLELTLKTLKRVDYWNNRNDYDTADRQLNSAIRRVTRALGEAKP